MLFRSLIVTMVFIAGFLAAVNAVIQRAVLEGSTRITVDINQASIKGLVSEIETADGLDDARALTGRLAAFKERTSELESLFVSDGTSILASSDYDKAGSPLGGGDKEKGSDIRKVIESGSPLSEIEKRTDIVPRLTYIHPVSVGGVPVAALVAKYSLREEFGAITHLREALLRIVILAGAIGAPMLFGLLWILAIGPLRTLRNAAVRLADGDFDIRLPAATSSELSRLSVSLQEAAGSLKSHYERYLSHQVVAALQAQGGFKRGIRMRIRASVLMADIEGFTSLSERLDVDDLVMFLNGYFRSMTEIIFRNAGTLDKYMGDGILAVFGAPVATGDHRTDAVNAGAEMIAAFADEFRRWLPEAFRLETGPMRIRVGIATGEVFYGNIGYERRSDFTALGTAVNLASRLQELNKETGTTMLVDEETALGIADAGVIFRPAGTVAVRGLSGPIRAYGT